ncbi:ectonucleotide pyrophosphatase/phosphodiesterase [Leptospira ilyithenensis]|uniref:Alkaline phosphatase family protein n=1 Tax=Leptospira ilyithenensis TaxID=2484901 RepID=A0A4R9LQF5_9LEPT|nr:ectonucleotide pyrophosphatase/phosphodiesterase [Leptospira ilyithenensis]TGN08210.1 alkaline phosphatase family protein [Leptospira ilyithenensis]
MIRIFVKQVYLSGFLAIIGLIFVLISFSSQNISAKSKKKKEIVKQKLIVLSIDGFPGYYFDSPEILSLLPNLKEFSEKSSFSREIQTVNPSVTYPAHTSMVTGVDPSTHGILNNTLVDPFEKNDGGWTWYAEDIKTGTLWDYAKLKSKKTGNVFWPVTVGAAIDYNLPQIWRKRIPEDDKLLRALSTGGLHKRAELAVGEPLNDVTKDLVKFRTGFWLFETFQPDLLFLYTTDLDSTHHAYGPGSTEAKEKLKQIDSEFGEFVKALNLYNRNDLALLLISDHGFSYGESLCQPNVYLLNKGWILPDLQTYDFIFKSSGGSAILLPGNRNTLTEEERISLKNDLEMNCPGTKWRDNSEDISDLRKSQHPDALGLLTTKEKIYISGSRKGSVFQIVKQPIYGHGYDNQNPEMKTIGGFYFKKMKNKEDWKMSSVKDVFVNVCRYLDLDCKK